MVAQRYDMIYCTVSWYRRFIPSQNSSKSMMQRVHTTVARLNGHSASKLKQILTCYGCHIYIYLTKRKPLFRKCELVHVELR